MPTVQAVEAETLAVLRTVRPKRVLLAGDTKQLPATVLSQLAERRGYGRSMMSRLIGALGGGDRDHAGASRDRVHNVNSPSRDSMNSSSSSMPAISRTMLRTQYRMHPAIAALCNELFYDGLLQDAPCTAAAARKAWHTREAGAQPSLGPVRFLDVDGVQESRGTSLCNPDEAERAVNVVAELVNTWGLSRDDVCVMTFYSGQAALLRERLAQRSLEGVRAATVDSFQGSEAGAVVLSFVRSSRSPAGPTVGGTIGFLRDFRRLNVALSRARHTLVMLGHREVSAALCGAVCRT